MGCIEFDVGFMTESFGNDGDGQIAQIAGAGGDFVAVDLALEDEDSRGLDLHILQRPDVFKPKEGPFKCQFVFFGLKLLDLAHHLAFVELHGVAFVRSRIFLIEFELDLLHAHLGLGPIVCERQSQPGVACFVSAMKFVPQARNAPDENDVVFGA